MPLHELSALLLQFGVVAGDLIEPLVGLEPATNYPNEKSFEKTKGRVIALAPGETRRFEVTIEAHADAASVAAAEKAVAAIQGGAAPEIRPQPDPNWSPS